MKSINKIDKFLVIATEVFCAILLLLIVGICFSNTVARYVFNSPFIKAEEILRYMSVWLVLVGSSLTCRVDGHTTLDVLTIFIKNKKVKAALFIITRVLCLVCLILLIKPSFDMVKALGGVISAATRVPMAVLYYSFPVGAILMFIGYCRAIPECVKKIMSEENTEIVEEQIND